MVFQVLRWVIGSSAVDMTLSGHGIGYLVALTTRQTGHIDHRFIELKFGFPSATVNEPLPRDLGKRPWQAWLVGSLQREPTDTCEWKHLPYHPALCPVQDRPV